MSEADDLVLDARQLRNGGLGQKIMLIISAELGLLMGILLTGGLAVPILLGFIIVPAFGLTMGYVGLSRARNRVISGTRTKILPNDHAITKAVHGMAAELHLSTPPLVGIYPDRDINAFAAGSGRHKAVVSFSQGLVDQCTSREILAIAAHELAHIANNDMRRMQYAWSFQNALTWYMLFERGRSFARWILGTVGEMMILRLSRKREYWADATSAALLGKDPMIEALQRLKSDPKEPPASKLAYARLMIRPNPMGLFSTHPPIDSRIAALERGTYIRRLPYRKRKPKPSDE